MKSCEQGKFFSHMLLFYYQVKFQLYLIYHMSHANTNSTKRRLSHKKILISEYSSILHALFKSLSYVLGCHI